ncbi:hypothetical protein [Pontibacillus yanchengensis]|uniref:Uncharacterized protein n=1 Tax=Pontibacillus yanchengensis Y32 TaxID=1385514 RepID=A0A0A2TC59_9BACI|nr:hypothetical protein [Pontibacillus yanchengensis]KGP73377.1 hypothetical protein N782_05375 [Pontibacillus yanchengensis Y32]
MPKVIKILIAAISILVALYSHISGNYEISFPSLIQWITGFIIGAMAIWSIVDLSKKRKGTLVSFSCSLLL